MKVVIGLGNPGRDHAHDRHNVGFMVLDRVATRGRAAIKRVVHRAHVGEALVGTERVLLVKPQPYMNASGETAASLARYFQLAPDAFVVVHDDMDLPLGRIRVSWDGGAAGHRGVASVIAHLGNPGFARVRLGIGRPPAGCDPVTFVLSPFAPLERGAAVDAAERAAQAVEVLITEGTARAMSRFNQRQRTPSDPS